MSDSFIDMVEKYLKTNEGQVFDKPSAHVDHEESLRSAVQPTVDGKCPRCEFPWLHEESAEKNRHLYAGESFYCFNCDHNEIAIPTDPAQKTPEMVENPWKKAERLEKELAAAKQERDDLTRDLRASRAYGRDLNANRVAWECEATKLKNELASKCDEYQTLLLEFEKLRMNFKSDATLHERFVALENQLAESRRNFAIIAKLLRGTE